MKKQFFTSLSVEKNSDKKIFFPLSLLLHGFAAAALIVVPLLKADDALPEIKTLDVHMVAPLPPTPPPPPPRKCSVRAEKKKKGRVRPAGEGSAISISPVNVPETIEEDEESEDYGDFGPDCPGVEEGVDGGVLGGIPGGLLTGSEDMERLNPLKIESARIPRLLKKVKPLYPSNALRGRIQGKVIVEAVTGIYGRVVEVRVLTGNHLLNKAALDAVMQWVYEPYLEKGVPRPIQFVVIVDFRLTIN